MSRIGKKPMDIPEGVTVAVTDQTVVVKGPLGELSQRIPPGIMVSVENRQVRVTRKDDAWERTSQHGLMRTLVANLIQGVSRGFFKELEIHGLGFKAEMRGRTLLLSLGFSRPIEYAIPDGITVTVEQGTLIRVSGADKVLVGNVAARLRHVYPAEPYKGKGIRYRGERVRQKVGKTVA